MVSWHEQDFPDAPDAFWEQDARNVRDEYDLHVRHVEDDDRERLTRDEGER